MTRALWRALVQTGFVVSLAAPSSNRATALGLGTSSRAYKLSSSIHVETQHWMAPVQLQGDEPDALLSFSEEVSRVPPWGKHDGGAAARVNAATLDAWAYDAACRYPAWLAQSGFILKWLPNDLAPSAERLTPGGGQTSATGADCRKEALRPGGEGGVLQLARMVPVLAFGPVGGSTAADRASSSGGHAAEIPITGGLLTLVASAPSTTGGRPFGTLSFACRQTANGELEFRTALSG